MKGFVIAEEGHVVSVLSPQNMTGGVTGQAFSMKRYQHASIIIQLGAQAAAATKILVNACTDASGTNATAIAYNIYKQETAGTSHDVLGARTAEAAAGLTPSANANIFYVIEIDAAELDALSNPSTSGGEGYDYVQLEITNGANADYVSAVAVLSGARYSEQQSPTETT